MKAIVIKRKLSVDELKEVMLWSSRPGIDIYASIELPSGIRDLNKGEPALDHETRKRISYEIMDDVIAFGEREYEGKKVVDWLKFDQSSLWYYQKFRLYFRLRGIMFEHSILTGLSGRYEQVIYYAADPLLATLDLPEKVSVFPPTGRNKQSNNYLSLSRFALTVITRSILNLFIGHGLSRYDHIILDPSKRQTILDINTLKARKGNYVIAYLIDKASDMLILDEGVPPKISGGARLSINRDALFGKGNYGNRFLGEPLLMAYLRSGRLRRRKKQITANLRRAVKLLSEKASGTREKLILNILESISGSTNFYVIKYLAYDKFFSKHDFKSISTLNENSPNVRCILDAARHNGMKTIGIQHGNINDLQPAYIYTREDASRSAYPEKTLVWGKFWKAFLQDKGHYPTDSLVITGQVRSDIIPVLKQTQLSKEHIIPGIHKEEKMLVFASQPIPDAAHRELAALDVMRAASETDHAFLVVKLHPNEKDDIAYYEGLAKKCGLERYRILLSTDLYLLISVCDMLITVYSTVGTETVYFYKPLIILDQLDEDIQGFIKAGVGMAARNKDELIKIIKEIMNGERAIDEKQYARYIEKYAFAIDGHAADRVLEAIRSS